MNYNSLKSDIAAVVKTNGAQEITGANLQQVLVQMINNSVGAGYLYAGVATESTTPGTPDQNVFYLAGAGTYGNFGTTIPVGSVGVFRYNGTWSVDLFSVDNPNAVKTTPQVLTDSQKAQVLENIGISESVKVDCYPFANTDSQGVFDKCIVDAKLFGSFNYDVGLYTLANLGTQYQIRVSALNTDGTCDTTKGVNGIVATFVGDITTGISEITAIQTATEIIQAKIVVNWSFFPTTSGNKANTTYPRKFASILRTSVNLMDRRKYYNLTPVSDEIVWDNRTFFPELGWMKDFVVSLNLNYDGEFSLPVCIGQIRVLNNGRTFITLHTCTTSGIAPMDSASQICAYDNTTWVAPSLDAGGHRYETLSLSEKNNSGVVGSIKVDWSVLPIDYATQSTFVLYREFNVTNTLLSRNVFQGTKGVSGANTISFQIDGVDALLHTSSLYTPNGTPDWLMIISHGNGMGDNLSTALPSAATGDLTWFESHGVSLAVIRTQDEETAPYTTNATGWGNKVCISRTIKLYDYLMERYNFRRSVILAGESMGGCTMGALAYKKPFPIVFCLGCGVVPSVDTMFQNSSETYKASIRAAYNMSADGSDDADIATFVQGYDWYDMGLVDNKKIGYPNFYMYYGNDSTFRVNFGGVAAYQSIVNSFLSAGSYSLMKQAGTTDVDGHATDKCFALAISDGIFERELGL